MQTLTAPDLQVTNLSTGYTDTVVHNTSFSIKPGAVTAFVGPNGCGKSTLLKCMARLIKPHHGQVLLNQQAIHQLPTRLVAKQVALLPQGPIAPEGLTVKELVRQGRYPHQTLWQQWSEHDEQAVQQALDMTDTLALAEQEVRHLSGGQQQRCWIAMVLAQQTPIILLDEPTTYLDMRVQVDLLRLLQRLAHDQQRTIVLVLHELNLAAAFADHLIMMRNGRIQAQGSPEQVFTAANLATVFDLNAHVIRDPHSQQLLCVPAHEAKHTKPHVPRPAPLAVAL